MALLSILGILGAAITGASANAVKEDLKGEVERLNKRITELIDSVNLSYENAEYEFLQSRDRINEINKEVFSEVLPYFVEVFKKLKNVEVSGDPILNELDIESIERVSSNLILSDTVKSYKEGETLAFGALGGITLGGIFFVSNMMKSMKLMDEVEELKLEYSRLQADSEIINTKIVQINHFTECIQETILVVEKFKGMLLRAIEEMKVIINKNGVDYSLYDDEEKQILRTAVNLAGALKDLAQLDILDQDKEVNSDYKKHIKKMSQVDENKIFIEGKCLESQIDEFVDGQITEPLYCFSKCTVIGSGECASDYLEKVTFGYINKKGEEIVSEASAVVFTTLKEGLAPVKICDDCWTYCDEYDNYVGDIYELVFSFSCGIGMVKDEGKYGFVNKKAEKITDIIFNNASSFVNEHTWVELDGKYGIINKKGEYVVEPIYEDTNHFYEGLSWVKQDGKYGCINEQGEIVIDFKYDSACGFSEGYAVVQSGDKFGYINKQGNIVIDCIYDNANPFNEGVATVVYEGKCGIINKNNDITFIEQKVDFKEVCKDGLIKIAMNTKWNYEDRYAYGFINKEGQMVIEPGEYTNINNFSDGYAVAEYSGYDVNYFYIDKSGERLEGDATRNGFKDACDFHDGAAIVQDYYGVSVIDIDGNYIYKGSGLES